MKFQFPSNTKLESVNLRIKVTTGNKIRAIAKERDIPITEVYTTIIEEAIDEYRQLYPEKTNEVAKKKAQEIEVEKLPKEWLRKENLDSEGSYLYCANGNCKKYKFGKFLKGSETDRDGKVFCSIVCADEVAPIMQALPANFVYAYCQYLLCGKKKYISEDGIGCHPESCVPMISKQANREACHSICQHKRHNRDSL